MATSRVVLGSVSAASIACTLRTAMPSASASAACVSALTRKRMDLNDRPVGAARGAMG
jgi:hypothetical protein